MNMTGFFERERESPVEWNRGEQMRDARCEMRDVNEEINNNG